MALTAYQTAVINLIQAPSSPNPLIPTGTLTTYINAARSQVAADAECIRRAGTLTLAAGISAYGFGSISTAGTVAGIASVIAVRSARLGTQPIDLRPWEWFAQYYGGSAASGPPVRGAQQQQGVDGNLYLNPTPATISTLTLDTVCLPIPLTTDSTAEAIPQLWTDAVAFYAAWLAMQQLQRQADANLMFARYQELVRRGTQLATPSEFPNRQPGGVGTRMAGAHMPLGSPAPAGGR